MDIDQEYLANIFEGDQLFVFQEETKNVDYDIEKDAPAKQEVSEPQNDINSPKEKGQKAHKEVMILVNQDLGEKEKETLNKLLKAINIEEDQYEIIHDHPEQLKSIQHLKLFLSFHNQYVQSSEYYILKINKGNAIYAHDLGELNKDNSKKLMLWNLLKTIV
jgi:DNA polymerase III psi subunit